MKFLWETYVKPAAAIIAAFTAIGFCTLPIKRAAESSTVRGIDETALKAALGKGVLFGVLGGYRSLLSDFVWIKSFLEWEKKDASACVASMELATSIDPYMITFWTQGAAIMAYDIPHWKYQKLPPKLREPSALAAFKKKGAKMAYAYLDKALKIFPNDRELLTEKGQIAMDCGDDYPLAEECYDKLVATFSSDPPIYVRRTYAHILYRNGKFQKSLGVLEGVYKDADSDSPVRPIVEEQIRNLKKLLEKTQN